jgi:hypothetical protein
VAVHRPAHLADAAASASGTGPVSGPALERRSAWPVRLGYAYLALPVGIFLVGWLEWWWLIPALAMLVVGFWRMWVEAPKVWVPSWSRRTLVVAVVVSVILAAGAVFTGIGAVSVQHGDHAWRNAIFEMLVTEPWPVVLDSEFGAIALTYYFGFWLPAALIGKAFGLAVGWAALLAWAWVGLAVFACLVMSLMKRFAVWPIVVFAFFGGMDIVEKTIFGSTSDFAIPRTSVEWIDSFHMYCYTAFGDQIITVFNQSIPAWILTALIITQRDGRSVVAFSALAAIDSPLPLVGAVPIVLAWVISRPRASAKGGRARLGERLRASVREIITVQNVLIGLIGVVVFGAFYASNLNTAGPEFVMPQGWIDVARLGVFWVFEFVIMFGLVGREWRGSPLWWAALAVMMALPLARLGAWNDLAMRAVIPSQVVVYLMVCWTLATAKRPWHSVQTALLTIVLALGSGSVLHKVFYHTRADLAAIQLIADGAEWRVARETLAYRLAIPWSKNPTAQEYWPQYFGDINSFFYRDLSRASAPATDSQRLTDS